MDNYSDDEKESDDESDGSLGMSNLTFFTKNEEDPYITKNVRHLNRLKLLKLHISYTKDLQMVILFLFLRMMIQRMMKI